MTASTSGLLNLQFTVFYLYERFRVFVELF